jgi:hypothetical protein
MDKLLSILQELGKRIETLQKQATEFRTVAKQTDDLKKLAAAADAFGGQVLESSKASLANVQNAEAIVKDTAGQPNRPVKADALARQFRSVIEGIQKEAQSQTGGEIGVTLRSFDVELKGLIVVEGDSPAIVTPTPDRGVDPGQLSTVRLSYGSVPVLKTEVPTTPPPKDVKKR